MTAAIVYITAKDKPQAELIGRKLVEERLAACVNIMDCVTSLYWWEGQLTTDSEAVLIAKTKESLVDSLIECVRSVHSYECPCVVSWPITKGNAAYLSWIERETQR